MEIKVSPGDWVLLRTSDDEVLASNRDFKTILAEFAKYPETEVVISKQPSAERSFYGLEKFPQRETVHDIKCPECGEQPANKQFKMTGPKDGWWQCECGLFVKVVGLKESASFTHQVSQYGPGLTYTTPVYATIVFTTGGFVEDD